MKRTCKRILFILFAFAVFVFGCSTDSKTMSVSPTSVDFGDVNIGSHVEKEITLTNKYGKVLTIKAFNLDGQGDFLFIQGSSVPVVLNNGDEHIMTIRFEPLTDGKIEALLSIDHDCSEKEKTVSLKGKGLSCARIDFSEKSYDFLKKPINQSHTHDFKIFNNGTNNLEITGLNLVGSGATAYKVTQAPITVLPGTDTTITITFEPTALTQYDADIQIEHNGVNEDATFAFSVTGEGRNLDQQITLSQSSPWDFGNVTVNKSSVQVCEIENTGIDPLKVSSATLQTSAEFTVDSIKDSNDQTITLPFDIPVGEKIRVSIKFTPSAVNTFTDTLSIEHNGTNESSPMTIALTGDGCVNGLDFNGDGFTDVIVGADYDDDGGSNAGCVFVFYGSSTPLSTIDAALADVKFVGGDPNDGFGHYVSSAGDFNNDGFDDVIVGAHSDDDGGTDSGCAFIFYGSSSPASVIDASAANVKLVGADAGDKFGIRVSDIGDFNKDGIGDIVVGAYNDDDGGSNSGCAFIFYGNSTPASLIDASAADVKLVGGDAGDRFGVNTSHAGDFNKDGYDDVFVGSDCDDDGGSDAGCAFIFYGSATPPSVIDASAANVKFVGADAGDKFGYNISEKPCDFNGDGFDDVMVGAHADDDGGTDSGCAFIFFGSSSPAAVVDASNANVKLVGQSSGDGFGIRMSSAGDFNNDGYDDVIVGAYKDDDGGTDSGCAFIFFGSATPATSINASVANIKLVGGNTKDTFGHYVSMAGDFNNDGINDVIVGAYADDDGGTDSGCAFIFYGRTSPPSIIDASAYSVRLAGADAGDRFGVAVSG